MGEQIGLAALSTVLSEEHHHGRRQLEPGAGTRSGPTLRVLVVLRADDQAGRTLAASKGGLSQTEDGVYMTTNVVTLGSGRPATSSVPGVPPDSDLGPRTRIRTLVPRSAACRLVRVAASLQCQHRTTKLR